MGRAPINAWPYGFIFILLKKTTKQQRTVEESRSFQHKARGGITNTIFLNVSVFSL